VLPQRLFCLGQASLYAASDRDLRSAAERRRQEAQTNTIVTELPLKLLLLCQAFGHIVLH
jgi:hypothetical protein